MLGELCDTCHVPAEACTCTSCAETPQPCVPCESGECADWIAAHCVFWMGDAIEGTPIVKGTRLTEVITYLLKRISDIEASL